MTHPPDDEEDVDVQASVREIRLSEDHDHAKVLVTISDALLMIIDKFQEVFNGFEVLTCRAETNIRQMNRVAILATLSVLLNLVLAVAVWTMVRSFSVVQQQLAYAQDRSAALYTDMRHLRDELGVTTKKVDAVKEDTSQKPTVEIVTDPATGGAKVVIQPKAEPASSTTPVLATTVPEPPLAVEIPLELHKIREKL